ncbi:MAG: DUF4339 domain-containing protein [Pseudomonadota bacterium]
MTEDRIWYINADQQTYGPYTKDEIISLLKDGSVQYANYIFKEGFANWDFIYNIPEFDRRLINPGGTQPKVEAPKEAAPVVDVAAEKAAAEQVAPDETLWYVHDGEHQLGPYNTQYVKDCIDDKTFFWTYYVWREGFDAWVQFKDCKEFDRRKTPRGEKPKDLDITTNYDEIQKQAVHGVPTVDQNLYSEAQLPGNYQYGLTDADQKELRGKFPIKSLIFLIVLAVALFGAIRTYPKLISNSQIKNKEAKAEKLYEKAKKSIDQNKMEEGYDVFFDLMDMYPDTKVTRKSQNEILSKSPFLKGQLADEARKVKTRIDDYVRRYGIFPNNAVDISFTPSFWLQYFGDVYYKKDLNGKTVIMVKGKKLPVEDYMFVSDGAGKDTESEIKQSDFEIQSQSYIKLIYAGKKTVVKPLDIPQLLKKKETPSLPPLPAPTPAPKKPIKKLKKPAPAEEDNVDEQPLDAEPDNNADQDDPLPTDTTE